jgi:hypothetical protein
MKLKLYNKLGKQNWKEKRFVEGITQKLMEQSETDPSVLQNITPVNSIEELEAWHKRLTAQSVEFEEIPKDPEQSKTNNMSDTEKKPKSPDPFNRQEPNVRDYVLKDNFSPDNDTSSNIKSQYGEPLNFDDAFHIPTDEEIAQSNAQSNNRPSSSGGGSNSSFNTPRNNGGGDEVDPARARRRSKRFAKQIVEMTCMALEIGFVWYCSKDINENKLAEYELSGEMDLSLLLDMPDGDQMTVKEFFMQQLGGIVEDSKIEKEDREELTDALTEVFIERNIAPKPEWELALCGLAIAGKQTLKAIARSKQINGLIDQLKIQNAQMRQQPQQQYYEPSAPAPSESNDVSSYEPPINVSELTPSLQSEVADDLEILSSIQTKE